MQRQQEATSSMHERIKASRLRSPMVGASAIDKNGNGTFSASLGFIGGLQLQENVFSVCSATLISEVQILDEIISYFKEFYLPARWGNAMRAYQDLINLSSGIYADCKFDSLMNTISGILSQEGLSTFFARFFSTAIFDVGKQLNLFKAAKSDYQRWKYIGKIFSLVFNFKI
ncbi:UNKNOWN [Stylonychia lemnae]|uniref:Uncharacterized protein n=1 Tax=Stylonychia lemnae TaxID=5949 RepID=A0A078ANQ5_STYLE|nr:UNKNOWN [Stylonychia lemnae]|eukprot:CDW83799.1 UNKNOWN [Stylonychia lemnae]